MGDFIFLSMNRVDVCFPAAILGVVLPNGVLNGRKPSLMMQVMFMIYFRRVTGI